MLCILPAYHIAIYMYILTLILMLFLTLSSCSLLKSMIVFVTAPPDITDLFVFGHFVVL